VRWDQIAGLDDAKSQIRSLFAIALAKKPTGVVVEARPNILLFGPPGTGKTLIAAAASNGLDATFYSIKVGDLLSKYFGESPRLVESLYVEAKRSSPSVVFLDEMEALTPDRDSPGGVSGPEARILSQFLAELDGLDSKSSESMVITIAATNKPWLLDDAVLSRFSRTIYISLPNDEARRELFRLSIDGQGYTCLASWEELATVSDGRSGREIAAACKEAARNMLLRANPGLDDKVDEGAAAIRSYRLRTLPIAEPEIKESLVGVRPVTGVDMLTRYTSWRGGD
jgi:vacuolar protein-sorting-associated protein 4